jgi:hypothetical protein
MPQDAKEAFGLFTSNKSAGFKVVNLEEYRPIIRMIKHNLEQRKKS